jgi:hypothetical protein
VFGHSWIFVDAPAIDWILGAASPDMAGIFPGLLEEEHVGDAVRLTFTESDVQRRCTDASRIALGRAAAREWMWTYNLIQECLGSWTELNGLLVRAGVRASVEGMPDWVDAAYTVFHDLLGPDQNKWTAFEGRLRRTPKGLNVAKSAVRMSTRADLLAFAAD